MVIDVFKLVSLVLSKLSLTLLLHLCIKWCIFCPYSEMLLLLPMEKFVAIEHPLGDLA